MYIHLKVCIYSNSDKAITGLETIRSDTQYFCCFFPYLSQKCYFGSDTTCNLQNHDYNYNNNSRNNPKYSEED